MTPEISLVLPCYNEQDNIVTVLEHSIGHLKNLGRSWEIIVVDNHSSDNTPAVVREFIRGQSGVRLVVHDRNRLYSGSCRTGIQESRGKYIAIMDSDGQFTAADLPKFLQKLKAGANLVFGWRKKRNDPVFRKVISLVFNTMGRFWLRFPLHDLNVGIRMFDRAFADVAEIKHAINMSNPEFFVRACNAGMVIDEVPIEHFERTKGATSHNLFRFWKLFWNVNEYFKALSKEKGSTIATRQRRAA